MKPIIWGMIIVGGVFAAGQATVPNVPAPNRDAALTAYVLGPDDQITIRAVDVEEIRDTPVRIDADGYLRIPLAGRVKAAGLTTSELESVVSAKLRPLVLHPDVSISITEFRSQPVSVIGAVKNPGVYQLQGRKTLVEVLSMAGGLDAAAGPAIRISRSLARWGKIPLRNAAEDDSGQYSTAEVSSKTVLDGTSPQDNILLLPGDTVSVARAEMVYVIGQVQRSGGFPLNEHERITTLQALSLAGGLDRSAAPKRALILRPAKDGPARTEVPVNLAKILEGHGEDVALKPNDILFVPSSAPKRAAARVAEAAVQMGTGIVIWRR